MNITDFRNQYAGEDIFVIGSGRTLQYFDPTFFDNHITVAINTGWSHHLPAVDFFVTKYHETAKQWRGNSRVGTVVVTAQERGHVSPTLSPQSDILVVPHITNRVEGFTADHWPTDENTLVTSFSSITTGMHFAAYLGARRIMMVGADCGHLDTRATVEGHPPGLDADLHVLRKFENHNRIMKTELKKRYNADVVTVLPFSTPNMDGHRFQSHAGALNAP